MGATILSVLFTRFVILEYPGSKKYTMKTATMKAGQTSLLLLTFIASIMTGPQSIKMRHDFLLFDSMARLSRMKNAVTNVTESSCVVMKAGRRFHGNVLT